jgi:hypothetical protein
VRLLGASVHNLSDSTAPPPRVAGRRGPLLPFDDERSE